MFFNIFAMKGRKFAANRQVEEKNLIPTAQAVRRESSL